MNRLGRLQRRPPAAQRPGTSLLFAGGEEADQPELVAEATHHFLERGRSFAKRRRLVCRHLRELGFELEVDPAGPVLDREQRLRRERLEAGWQLCRPVGERSAGAHVRQHPFELGQPS